MAAKNEKDHAVMMLITGVTQDQAGKILVDVMKSKQKNAPNGIGRVVTMKQDEIGKMIQKEVQKIPAKN